MINPVPVFWKLAVKLKQRQSKNIINPKQSKLRWEIEFLEREMQRNRTKLDRLQQDPTQTPSMYITGLRPKQVIEPQDYHDREFGRI